MDVKHVSTFADVLALAQESVDTIFHCLASMATSAPLLAKEVKGHSKARVLKTFQSELDG